MLNCLPATPEQTLELLALGYRTNTPVYIVGPPGIGKTETVETFARLIRAKMPNPLILSTIYPEDLRGIPIPDRTSGYLTYHRLAFFPDSNSSDRWVLFYDELSNSDKRLQAPLQDLIRKNRIGDYSLPKDCYQVAAGNGINDNCFAYPISRALMDRFMVVNMCSDAESWLRRALRKVTREEPAIVYEKTYQPDAPIDERIITFIKLYPEYLHYKQMQKKHKSFNPDEYDILPTNRSWDMVDQILKDPYASMSIKKIAISGIVGTEVTTHFFNMLSDLEQNPMSPQELLKLAYADMQKAVQHLPKTMAGLWHLTFSIIYYCETPKDYRTASQLIETIAELKSELPVAEIATLGREQLAAKIINDPSINKSDIADIMSLSIQAVSSQNLTGILSELQ